MWCIYIYINEKIYIYITEGVTEDIEQHGVITKPEFEVNAVAHNYVCPTFYAFNIFIQNVIQTAGVKTTPYTEQVQYTCVFIHVPINMPYTITVLLMLHGNTGYCYIPTNLRVTKGIHSVAIYVLYKLLYTMQSYIKDTGRKGM